MIKQSFAYADTISQKFWDIEVTENQFTVNFGKVGTKGRTQCKTFANNKECEKAAQKLIAEKLKKGYVELKEGSPSPQPHSVEDTPEGRFWHAIEKSNKKGNKNWKTYDIDEHLEALTKFLSKWSKEQEIEFEIVLQQTLQRLYKASIKELSMILENDFKKEGDKISFDGYISTDGFIYFRCWMILKGKEFFDDITQDINAFIKGKYSFNIGDTWAEGLLYVTDMAYSEHNENEDQDEIRNAVYEKHPEINYDLGKEALDREPVSGFELQKMYPRLVSDIISIR